MIQNSKQDWSVGREVRVGFLTLMVAAIEPTPGDYAPDAYILMSRDHRYYRFVPHNGLTRIDYADACAAMAKMDATVEALADAAIANARRAA